MINASFPSTCRLFVFGLLIVPGLIHAVAVRAADWPQFLGPDRNGISAETGLVSESQTPVLHNGYLYGMDNVGGAGPITHLTCIEAATGKVMWQEARFGKGNLIGADGKLFITTLRGELVVVKATPERFEEIGRMTTLGKGGRTGPALAGGRLYLRDNKQIVCLSAGE